MRSDARVPGLFPQVRSSLHRGEIVLLSVCASVESGHPSARSLFEVSWIPTRESVLWTIQSSRYRRRINVRGQWLNDLQNQLIKKVWSFSAHLKRLRLPRSSCVRMCRDLQNTLRSTAFNPLKKPNLCCFFFMKCCRDVAKF